MQTEGSSQNAVLGAVAVMRVPVDDRHALDAVRGLRVQRGERGVAEDAAAHAPVGQRVVARRPDEGVRVVDAPLDDRVDGGQAGAGGERAIS